MNEKSIASPRKDEKELIMNRLKRIEGQVRGIQNMVNQDRYCIDVLVQISAVNAALNKAGYALMEQHVKHCVSDAIKTGHGDESIEELMEVVKQFSK